jgi:hypothetical protein
MGLEHLDHLVPVPYWDSDAPLHAAITAARLDDYLRLSADSRQRDHCGVRGLNR